MKVFCFMFTLFFHAIICDGVGLAFLELTPRVHIHLTPSVKMDPSFKYGFRARPMKKSAIFNLILQSKQDSKPSKDLFDMFAGAISGLVAVTGATIDYRDADEREETTSTAVNNEPDITSGKDPEADIAERALRIDTDLEQLFGILCRDSIDDPAEFMDLIEGIICGLVSWVTEQPFNIGLSANFTLPTVHLSALRLIGRLQEQIKASDPKLYSSFKWVAKKNGLSPLIAKALSRYPRSK
jgi:hypothetical protein